MEKRHIIKALKDNIIMLKNTDIRALSDKSKENLVTSISNAINYLENETIRKKDLVDTKNPDSKENTSAEKKSDLSESIDLLSLSPRSSNALKRRGFMLLKDIEGISEDRLRNIKGLGDSSVKEILKKAEETGLRIKRK